MLALEKDSKVLDSDKFKFEMFVDGAKKGATSNVTVQLFEKDGSLEKAHVDLQITNPYRKDLHFSLLYLEKGL